MRPFFATSVLGLVALLSFTNAQDIALNGSVETSTGAVHIVNNRGVHKVVTPYGQFSPGGPGLGDSSVYGVAAAVDAIVLWCYGVCDIVFSRNPVVVYARDIVLEFFGAFMRKYCSDKRDWSQLFLFAYPHRSLLFVSMHRWSGF